MFSLTWVTENQNWISHLCRVPKELMEWKVERAYLMMTVVLVERYVHYSYPVQDMALYVHAVWCNTLTHMISHDYRVKQEIQGQKGCREIKEWKAQWYVDVCMHIWISCSVVDGLLQGEKGIVGMVGDMGDKGIKGNMGAKVNKEGGNEYMLCIYFTWSVHTLRKRYKSPGMCSTCLHIKGMLWDSVTSQGTKGADGPDGGDGTPGGKGEMGDVGPIGAKGKEVRLFHFLFFSTVIEHNICVFCYITGWERPYRPQRHEGGQGRPWSNRN